MINNSPDDIICAPASGRGGAISVVRVSGHGCLAAIDKLVRFRSGTASDCPGFRLKFGVVPELDEVLVCVFRAPHSYTGEDMAEISCHASSVIVSAILERLCEYGCRLAQAGEFTQRAFVAGKMDLSQAEAVADLIAADTVASHRLAFSQLRGAYSQKLRALRTQMVELSALLELELDFSEEEVEFADRKRFRKLASDALAEVMRLADSFRLGNAFKKGVPVAIVGAVNSGKSTLLNALLGEERALVSDIPGTTRDTVEEVLVINGVAYRFIDTAGLREGAETVEQMGIERSFTQMEQAAVVLVLLDGTSGLSELSKVVYAIKERVSEGCRIIWVRSKSDLFDSLQSNEEATLVEEMVEKETEPCVNLGLSAHEPGQKAMPVCNKTEFCTRLGITDVLDISAKTGRGLNAVKAAIAEGDSELLAASEGVLVSNQRHQDALRAAASELERFLSGLDSGLPSDLLSEDIRSATSSLGQIFGEITHDEVSGLIFSKFCIGK